VLSVPSGLLRWVEASRERLCAAFCVIVHGISPANVTHVVRHLPVVRHSDMDACREWPIERKCHDTSDAAAHRLVFLPGFQKGRDIEAS
jgi:hypothetical protein